GGLVGWINHAMSREGRWPTTQLNSSDTGTNAWATLWGDEALTGPGRGDPETTNRDGFRRSSRRHRHPRTSGRPAVSRGLTRANRRRRGRPPSGRPWRGPPW